MNLIPDEELQKQGQLNLAPMVDFLFVLIAVFAVFTATRTAFRDTEIQLVKAENPNKETETEEYVIDLSVTKEGQYRWITEMHRYCLSDPGAIRSELLRQKAEGLLPKSTELTKVLLHIDENAPWDSVARLVLAVREAGFKVSPVYELAE